MNSADFEDDEGTPQKSLLSLTSASDEQLIAELARRRAGKYKLAGAMKRLTKNYDDDDQKLPADEFGQMCSLRGGGGLIQ